MDDPRLQAHDANQLELKLAYLVEPGVKRQRYLVETFMFVPRSLGVSGKTYGASEFFEDTQTYVRLKTPSVALEALAKAGHGESWFDPTRAEVDRHLGGGVRNSEALVKDLKVLGSIYRSAIRDEGWLLQTKFAALDEDIEGAMLRERTLARSVDNFLTHLSQALARLRAIGGRCEHVIMPQEVRETWAAVDEYVAIYAEEIATSLVQACDERLAHSDTEDEGPLYDTRKRLAEQAISEYKYRRSRGYPSYAIPGASNEDLPRRRRILKRIVSSVLYLDLQHEEGGAFQRDLIAGAAAAVAMLFAALVSIWAQLEWGPLSSTFVLILVISYIIKDRLKDWGKRFLGKRFGRWLPHFKTEVRSPDADLVIGSCREWFNVSDPARLDPSLLELRHADHPSAIASHGRPEVVVRYSKEVILDSKGLQGAIEGVDGLNDIIRINFARLRGRMDQPIEKYRIVHPTTKQVVEVPCSRVYHINLILQITRGDAKKGEPSHRERVRVVIDSEGLRRVESIRPNGFRAVDAVMGLSLESAHMVSTSQLPGAPDASWREGGSHPVHL